MNKTNALKIEGFSYKKIKANKITINTASSGNGMPVVLLHGFPETHLAWRNVAPELAKNYTVICPDLRGYGESDKPKGSKDHANYSKREMAKDIHALMQELGFEKYAVIGHDRGALVGFRLALDYQDEVTHLGILDVIPTADMWDSLQGIFGVFSYHLFFLAQQGDFPEKMIGADPKTFFEHTLTSWSKTPKALPPEILAHYIKSFSKPESIHAICEDYRAGAFVDMQDDQRDKAKKKKIKAPVSVLWQDPQGFDLPFDPLKVWQSWASKVKGNAVPCGHLIPEEKPKEVIEMIQDLVK